MTRVLHGYFRSSAAYRVRIALNLKGLDYEPVSVHLRKGEQRAEAFLALNPQGMVPALVDGEAVLTQSPAILEYLDEAYPETPRLLPGSPVDRARVRALAAAVACDIHPINNLRVLKYVQGPLGCSQDAMVAWYNHWIAEGFGALERMLADDPRTGRFCHGDAPGLADVCLVPQVVNSQRHALDLAPYPTIRRIAEACDALPAFQAAHPSRQPDAE
ncbi:maleylacetoacetate isomerase [Thalassobaculum sp.]|uniref:maleylacetoacetate isomerase n=1 Tax=Thalassobaculum sp. TaxID=2022740 RepID=UPI0032EAA6FD